MKIKREWNEEQDAANIVTDALEIYARDNKEEDGEVLNIYSSTDETSSYGDKGYIQLRVGNRRFLLELHEIQ